MYTCGYFNLVFFFYVNIFFFYHVDRAFISFSSGLYEVSSRNRTNEVFVSLESLPLSFSSNF